MLPAPARASAGDIICATRADTKLAPDQLDWMGDGSSSPPLHCEIVVAVNEQTNTLFFIGGNVQQTVARSEVALDANGRIEHLAGATRPWILVMRARRDTSVQSPVGVFSGAVHLGTKSSSSAAIPRSP